jgi:hypothetical protein
MAQVRKHAAGNLMLILGEVVFHRRADCEALALSDCGEVLGDRLQNFFIDRGFVAECTGVFGDVEQRRIRGIIGQGRHGGVDGSNAELHSL